jgi:ACT domain-containing protein
MTDPNTISDKPNDSGKELSFITVIGNDQKGIVARISSLLYEHNINIEDIAQRVMHGHFVMIMLVDFKESPSDLENIKAGLDKIGEEMKLRIQIQHEDLFKMMHRV